MGDGRLLLAVAVAVLAVTAGCNGLADRATDRTRTVTPVEVPAERSVAGTALPSPEQLAARHERVLRATNYTVEIRERVGLGNRTRRLDRRRRVVGRGGDRYLLRRERETDDFPSDAIAPVVSYWYDGSRVVSRVGADGATVREFPASAGPLDAPSDRGYLRRVTAAFDLRRVDTDDGTVLRSSRLVDPEVAPTTPFVGEPRNASLTLRVDPDGYVESYRYAYDATAPSVGRAVRVVRTVRFEDVGSTDVARPPWVDGSRRTG